VQSRRNASNSSFDISNAGRTVEVGADLNDKANNFRIDTRILFIDLEDDATDVRKDGGNGGEDFPVSDDVASVVGGAITPIRRYACQNSTNLQLSNNSAQLFPFKIIQDII